MAILCASPCRRVSLVPKSLMAEPCPLVFLCHFLFTLDAMANLYYLLVIVIALLHSLVAMYLLSLPIMLFRKNVPVWYLKIHLIIFSIAAIFHFTSGVCPLTFAENYCRGLGGLQTYHGNFLNHYAEEFFHFSIPNKLVSNSIIALAVLLIIAMIKTFRLKQSKPTAVSL